MNDRERLESTLRQSYHDAISAVDRQELDRRLEERLRRNGRRWHPSRLTLAVLIAVAMLLPAIAVAGVIRSQVSEAPFGLIDAAGFEQEIEAAKTVVPKPAAARWPGSLTASDPTGTYARGGGRVQVESVAFCLWSADWVSAIERRDSYEASVALAALRSVRSWDLYQGLFSTSSTRALVDAVVDGAGRGDQAAARAHLAASCSNGS